MPEPVTEFRAKNYKHEYRDRSDKQMNAAAEMERKTEQQLTQQARKVLNSLTDKEGRPVQLSDLLQGSSKMFGEVLSRRLDKYYQDVFVNRPKMEYLFDALVKRVFDLILEETATLTVKLLANKKDPSIGALPTLDKPTTDILMKTFIQKAKQQRAA